MNTATATKTAAITIGIVAAAASTCAANDNAGLAWRVDDAAPCFDDARQGIELRVPRVATQVATNAAPLVNDMLWRVDASRATRSRSSIVTVWPRDAWSRAVRRRVRTMLEFARAAGLDALMWGW